MILITADWHLSDNPRDSYRHGWQKQLLQLVDRYEIHTVLVLGDLTEDKDRHRAGLVNQVTDHLYRLAKRAWVVLVKGNHDYIDPDTPFYGFTRRIDGVQWINSPTTATVEGRTKEVWSRLGRVLFLPHTANYKRDWTDLKLSSYDWIFAHNTFQDAILGHGQRADNGIPLGIISGGPRVISGDVHIPQQLGPVTYVGAPYTIDFGDDYHPRVLIIDKQGRLSPVACSGPQKRLVEVADIKHLGRVKNVNRGDIVKVRVDLPMKDHAQWPAIQERVRAWGSKAGVAVHTIQPVRPKEALSSKRQQRERAGAQSDEAVLQSYAKLRQIEAATLKTGLGILRKV